MIFKNAMITTIDKQFLGYLELDDKGKIINIIQGNTSREGIDCKGYFLMPSFIDSHTHGGYGFSFNDILKQDGIEKLAAYKNNLANEGVGYVFASTVTDTWDNVKNMAQKYNQIIDKDDTLLTLYLEGPFISPEKKGAHPADKIIPLDSQKLDTLKEKFPHKKLIIVVAPENGNNRELIEKYSKDFTFSLGHSNAYDLSKDNFFNNHIKRITHLFNATSMFNHRAESIVNTAFENNSYNEKAVVELIGDAKHVDAKVLKLTYEIIPHKNIVIVSDSLPQKGLPDGFYTLGFLETEKKGDLFYVKKEQTLAGSGMPYNRILEAFHKATNASWQDMVRFSSYNAAKNIGLENHLGIIEINHLANFVVVDKNFDVKIFVKNGEKII